MKELNALAALLTEEGTRVLADWRLRVRALPSAKNLDTPTLNDHIPLLLEEIAAALIARDDSLPDGEGEEASPPAHGLQRLEAGFDIEEVVAEYGILRATILEAGEERGIAIRGKPVRILNRVLDDAIGMAVKSFAEYQALEVQRRRDEHLAFVAHDLRTPLGAILLAARVLELRLAQSSPDPDAAKMTRTLVRSAMQLDTLVNAVLKENTQAAAGPGVKVERRDFELWPLVEAIVQDLAQVAQRSDTRLFNEVPEELRVNADAALLRRVFQNLVSNAITYTPGGTVRIRARAATPGTPAECWVIDDGAGIPASRLGQVFDALETDPDGTGTGLGLAIVKTFIEAHGGTVSASSIETRGTTLHFTLPTSPAPPAPPAAPPTAPAKAAPSAKAGGS